MCKIIFFCFSEGGMDGGDRVKGQKAIHNYQFQSVTLYISGTVDHILKSFGNHQELQFIGTLQQFF